MSNMSYCRFRNTLSDLRDCFEDSGDDLGDEYGDELLEEEADARLRLIRFCRRIAEVHDEVGD